MLRRSALFLFPVALALLPCHPGYGAQTQAGQTQAKVSKAAAEECVRKVNGLEAYATSPEPRKKRTTRLTADEINSYLEFELKPKFHPSLRGLSFTFEDNKLAGLGVIDFDKLNLNSSKFFTKLLAGLFSGTHSLRVSGTLLAKDGKASFQLEEARFDDSVLPNFLVSEIITAVGRKQKPPFDPMQPSKMPYDIDRVEVHGGYIMVFQGSP